MSVINKSTNEWLTKVPPLLKLGFGGLCTLWGMWVANPFWVIYPPASPVFDLLHFIPENGLGLILIVVGISIFVTTVINRAKWLMAAAMASSLAWAFLSVGFWINDWHALGGIVYLGFALFSSYLYISEGVVTQSERRHGVSPALDQ